VKKVFAWRKKQCVRRWSRLGVIFLSVIGMVLIAFIRCRSVLTAFAESQAVWIATKTANRIVAEVLKESADLCTDIVTVTYADNHRISSIIPDTVAVNTVRTAITARSMAAMEQERALAVPIPFGTLIGVDWLSGWGPLVPFSISYTGTVLSDVTSSFEAVGMNQSIYRVLVHLDISLYVVTPGGRSSVGTQMSYPMAEAVILGEVPDNLTEVYGDDQSLLGRIFDYGTIE